MEDPLTDVTTYTYSSTQPGMLTAQTAPAPAGDSSYTLVSYQYDSQDRLTTITNADSDVTVNVYSSAGQVTKVTDPNTERDDLFVRRHEPRNRHDRRGRHVDRRSDDYHLRRGRQPGHVDQPGQTRPRRRPTTRWTAYRPSRTPTAAITTYTYDNDGQFARPDRSGE